MTTVEIKKAVDALRSELRKAKPQNFIKGPTVSFFDERTLGMVQAQVLRLEEDAVVLKHGGEQIVTNLMSLSSDDIIDIYDHQQKDLK